MSREEFRDNQGRTHSSQQRADNASFENTYAETSKSAGTPNMNPLVFFGLAAFAVFGRLTFQSTEFVTNPREMPGFVIWLIFWIAMTTIYCIGLYKLVNATKAGAQREGLRVLYMVGTVAVFGWLSYII